MICPWSLCWHLWNRVNLVLISFGKSLFSFKLLSSLFAFSNKIFVLLWEQNRLVSPPNIIGVQYLETKPWSFMYIKKRSNPRVYPCGTPNFICIDAVFSFSFNPIRDGGMKKAPHQFFPWNFYKRRTYLPKLFDF